MAYDAVHGQVVLFGGLSSTFELLNDTLVWDGTNWSQDSPQSSPAPRSKLAMAYDSAASQVLLSGGQGATVLGDT